MIDLNKLTKEQLETLVEWGMEDEIRAAVAVENQGYTAVGDGCRARNDGPLGYHCYRDAHTSGCHISVFRHPILIWNDPAPVGVPAGLAVSICRALLTGAEHLTDEVYVANMGDLIDKCLYAHPEKEVASWACCEIANINGGDYAAR